MRREARHNLGREEMERAHDLALGQVTEREDAGQIVGPGQVEMELELLANRRRRAIRQQALADERVEVAARRVARQVTVLRPQVVEVPEEDGVRRDRKSTRLNSSHRCISYAVFCLKKKTN